MAFIIEESWEKMLKQHFDGCKHFVDSLYDMERKANELWGLLTRRIHNYFERSFL